VQKLIPVTVTFFVWSVHSTLAVVLLIALTAGVLITLLVSLPGWIRDSLTTSGHKKKLTSLEEERNKLQQKAEELEKSVKDLQDKLAGRSSVSEPSNSGQAATGQPQPTDAPKKS